MSRRSVPDHRAAVAHAVHGLRRTESVQVRAASGRVASADVRTEHDIPFFDNSAMDGFAVRAAESGGPLRVTQRVYAGASSVEPLAAGTAAAIMTGAPIPDGADAVIPVEESVERDGVVSFTAPAEPGAFVRARGDDVRAGALIVADGTMLAPHHLGALAAAGVDAIGVVARPRVAVISTGSELRPAGATLAPGEIYESNATLLAALVDANGGTTVSAQTCTDADGAFAAALASATGSADLIVTSGGVSMGEREPVRTELAADGWFGPVAMQPGGPQGLARRDGIPVCALPGNPVSVLVSFEMLLRGPLRALAGLPPVEPETARLDVPAPALAGRTRFLRGARTDDGRVRIVGGPGSHLVVTSAAADVLIEIPPATPSSAAAKEVRLWPLTT